MSHEHHLTPFDAADEIDWDEDTADDRRWPVVLAFVYAAIAGAMLWATIALVAKADWWGAAVFASGALFVIASPWLFGDRGAADHG